MIGAVSLGAWDWVFLIWFLGVTLGVGLYYARRAGSNLSEYFVSGRSLPWWALGTSMVATTFAADTPLVVTGFIITQGIAKNWLWWSFLIGGTLTVFVFSRWWRRAGVTTEIELIARRYDGKAASMLRGFKAVYLGLVLNSLVFGWVTKAMGQIVEQVFDVPKVWSLGILLAITLGYTSLSGLWGVVAADVLQFAMAMVGAVLLAVLCVSEVGGLSALVDKVSALEVEHGRDLLSLFPTDWTDAFTIVVVVLVLVNWWAVYYPGAEPGGGGYVAQRMLAAKDERHARAGTLWYIFAHYVLRPWPWILVALAAVVLQPGYLSQPGAYPAEQAYPAMFEYLPVGLLGLVVASFFAAFMSTITTQLNLSASYLVNDLYLPFLSRGRESERSKVHIARLAVALVTAVGCVIAWQLESAGSGWEALMQLTAGTGLVLLARWLWWRVNAWSEISAMIGSAVAYVILNHGPGTALVARLAGDTDSELANTYRLLLTVGFSTAVWVTTTLLTRPVGDEHLASFYTDVRPGGFWGAFSRRANLPRFAVGRDVLMWLAATVMVFGSLLGLGSALLIDVDTAVWCLGAAAGGAIWLLALFRRERLAG